VKFYESSFSYDYSFPAVTLAYFLRYPNPYSTHVLSTDVIDRSFDPVAQRLYTTRLHLKRSKLPPAVLKLLPKSILGGTSNNSSQAYILEKSVVDVKEGWMETESRNLEWTGVLSVVERQMYRRPSNAVRVAPLSDSAGLIEHAKDETTDVTTAVTFHSRFGQARKLRNRAKGEGISTASSHSSESEEETPVKKGLFQKWSTSSIQGSIELVGLKRTRDALVKSKEGMNVVLERLRQGGLGGVLEGMRKDRESVAHREGPWKRVWHRRHEEGLERTQVDFESFEDE